jgi:predicted dehydrogenase
LVDIKDGANYAPTGAAEQVVAPGEFCFAAAYLDHGHIYGQTNGLCDAGATLKTVYDPDPQKVAKFVEAYPGVTVADSFEQVLADPEIRLVSAAAVPNIRATIGISVLEAGKDYFTDKSPFTSLEQLDQLKEVVQRTRRKYAVYYAERLHNDAAWRAGEMIADGAIGRVIQVLNLAPHRLAKDTRPDWFFDKACYGGILTDIGSHQVEQFLTYAGCAAAWKILVSCLSPRITAPHFTAGLTGIRRRDYAPGVMGVPLLSAAKARLNCVSISMWQ